MNALPRFFNSPTAWSLLALLVLPIHGYGAPSEQDCKDAWEYSSASSSCGDEYRGTNSQGDVCWYADTSSFTIYVQNNACQVWVDCYVAAQWECERLRANSYSGSPDQVLALRNCDGDLKSGSC